MFVSAKVACRSPSVHELATERQNLLTNFHLLFFSAKKMALENKIAALSKFDRTNFSWRNNKAYLLFAYRFLNVQ